MKIQNIKEEQLRISVIVPIYKVEKYLDDCIQSIRQQTYKNLEIILVDDGSPDLCPQMCDLYAKEDCRIKVIHKKNGGLVGARKSGVAMATGDYVAYVDGDDWIDCQLLENMIQVASKTLADMICCLGYYKEYEDGRRIEIKQSGIDSYVKCDDFETKLFPHFICLDEFYSSDLPATLCCYMFKRELICENQKLVSDKIVTGEDMTCLFRCFLKAESVATIDWSGYHYRQRNDSILHTRSEARYEELNILYHETMEAIELSRYNNDILKKKLCLWMYFAIMISCAEKLFKKNCGYLFPYPQVKNGSRLIIYGAGVMGQQLFYSLKECKDFDVVGWSDKGWESYKKRGLPVIAPVDILKLEYDYLVISVTRKALLNQVERELLELGIEKSKIAVLDEKLFIQDNLPF